MALKPSPQHKATTAQEKTLLRRTMRKKRKALPRAHQKRAATNLLRTAKKLPQFRYAKKIGFYFASDGEIHLDQLLNFSQKKNCRCFFPTLRKTRQLKFRQAHKRTRWKKNRYAILEPLENAPSVNIRQLDILFIPLVSFDQNCNRLGMGGGFYDATLTYRGRKPTLVGVAHACQESRQLPTDIWDIPMDYLLTDRKFIKNIHKKKNDASP